MDEEWTERERGFMRLALQEAEAAYHGGETPVACVIVLGDSVIARGSNRTNASRNGTRHAEFEAVDHILLRSDGRYSAEIFKQCELYVTCEPCIMCGAALRILGIGRVVFGCRNDRFGGNGSIISAHSDSKPEAFPPYPSRGGLLADEAVKLLREFYVRGNVKAPKPHRKIRREESLASSPSPIPGASDEPGAPDGAAPRGPEATAAGGASAEEAASGPAGRVP